MANARSSYAKRKQAKNIQSTSTALVPSICEPNEPGNLDTSSESEAPTELDFEAGSAAPTSARTTPALDPDSNAEDLPEPITAIANIRAQAKRKASEEPADERNVQCKRNIILLVPEPTSEATQRISLDSETPFLSVLNQIHEVLGCAGITRKPDLAYKLSTAAAKSSPITLRTSADWDGLLETLLAAEAKKKPTRGKNAVPVTIPVTIIVPEVYLNSLRARAKKGPGKGLSSVSLRNTKASARKALPILDLDHEDDDDGSDDGMDNEGGSDFYEREDHQLALLENKLKSCARCGPDKFCKIDKSGTHVGLTMAQRRSWANALAHHTHGVTLLNPPKNDHFSSFYSDKAVNLAAPPMAAQLPPFPPSYPSFLPGYGAPPWAMDPRLLFPHLLGSPALPVAAPPSTGLVSVLYPTTTEFFADLADAHPERPALMELSRKFADEDILWIDEVLKLTQERLEDKFRLSVGNALFVLEMVKQEMSRLHATK
ncbi:hypothetical protein EYR36_005839 [Pleurotus pulmonarius]|nr:hypothetical protein EYR36_005839 [Pleurotus pulmonarius]KAF4600557.1 hypothetical protein EYR38_005192 [Pleurotus pulmonarius]